VPVVVAASLSTSLLWLSSWLPSSRTTAFVADDRGVGDVALAVGAGSAGPSPGRRRPPQAAADELVEPEPAPQPEELTVAAAQDVSPFRGGTIPLPQGPEEIFTATAGSVSIVRS
jgi:hypothetical protein